MNFSITKKIVVGTIIASFITLVVMLGMPKKAYSYTQTSYTSSLFDIKSDGDNSYSKFLKDADKNFPEGISTVNIEDYKYENGLFEDSIPYIAEFIDDNKVNKTGLYMPETGDTTLKVIAPEDGLYNLKLDYFTVEGRGASINRGIKINGEYQYLEAESISLLRFWKDEHSVTVGREPGKNDIRPKQIEVNLWEETFVEDQMGYYKEPFYFELKQGLNEITFVSNREPLVIGSMEFTQAPKINSYSEYVKELKQNGAKEIDGDFNFIRQAEEAYLKSSPSLNPIAEYSTPKYEPYEKQVTKYNAIGGINWRIPGDEISWEVTVPESGFYNLTFTVMQNFERGQNVTRKLLVNGEVPFSEANFLEFKYNKDLYNYSVNNGEVLPIYLEKGTNIIGLKSTIGIYGNVAQRVNVAIKELRGLYREVVMKTGLNPDPVQDYMLEKNIKDLNKRIKAIHDEFEEVKSEIVEISNGRNGLISVFDRINYQLLKFIKDEKNIQNGLKEWEQNISNLGSWVVGVSEQPLTIDKLIVSGSEYKPKKVKTNFFERLWHEIILFIESFKNTGDFGSTLEIDGAPTIEVWIGTGRDQATITRQLIDESFVVQNNVNVRLKMVNMSVLLSATLAGNGPDVAIGVSQKLPVNWGVRNGIKDLSELEGFSEVESWFSKSSLTPMQYGVKTYGLPDTEDFLVTFYRDDILKDAGINQIPKTWDEVIDISPALQKQYFDFYIPLIQGQLSPVLYSMMVQNGGSLYLSDGAESGLLQKESLDAFINFSRFFTDYGFVLEANFINRFRSGEMPIGVSNFSTYNSLAVFAPEITGQWQYGAFPGTIVDGQLNNQTTSSITSSIILESTKNVDASWKFLKWWLSADTQLAYARGMEAVLGAAARYPTANLEAFSKLPWSAKDLILLEEQRSNAVGVPTVPGDYIVGRYIDNAFRQTLNDKIMPQDSIYQYHLRINEELTRKRKELGLA